MADEIKKIKYAISTLFFDSKICIITTNSKRPKEEGEIKKAIEKFIKRIKVDISVDVRKKEKRTTVNFHCPPINGKRPKKKKE